MDHIDELLTRGVENIIPGRDKLRELLETGKKLNIYLGIDPTATNIHIGHAVPLRKLNAFARQGHHVTFLIGDFTALIGDTSDKDSERPVLSPEQIEENFQTYKAQAEKILDFSQVTVRFNSEWLRDLKFADIVKLCQHFSAGEFVGRELIKKRLAEGKKVGLHELLYPVMQGYDSFHLDTDIQLGGTDQTFNMQAGRVLLKDLADKESFIIANGFLEGTDGRKMSKSWGNAIWLTDKPNEMFGKVMSLRDELIVQYFTLATSVPMDAIATIEDRLRSGENPMIVKKELAVQLVTELHDADSASKALTNFEQTFGSHNLSHADIPEIALVDLGNDQTVGNALIVGQIIKSKSEFRRLLKDRAIDVNGKTVLEDAPIGVGDIIQAGKKKFLKLI